MAYFSPFTQSDITNMEAGSVISKTIPFQGMLAYRLINNTEVTLNLLDDLGNIIDIISPWTDTTKNVISTTLNLTIENNILEPTAPYVTNTNITIYTYNVQMTQQTINTLTVTNSAQVINPDNTPTTIITNTPSTTVVNSESSPVISHITNTPNMNIVNSESAPVISQITGTPNMTIVNSETSPVISQITGTPNMTIVNSETSPVISQITGTPDINIVNVPSMTISGIPNMNVANSPDVNVINEPNVLVNNPTTSPVNANITNTVNVNLASTNITGFYVANSADVPANVEICNTTPVETQIVSMCYTRENGNNFYVQSGWTAGIIIETGACILKQVIVTQPTFSVSDMLIVTDQGSGLNFTLTLLQAISLNVNINITENIVIYVYKNSGTYFKPCILFTWAPAQ